MKIALAQINPTVGSLKKNREKIIAFVQAAEKRGAELVVFPEMALLGYPPEDLLTLDSFVKACEESLLSLAPLSQQVALIVGGIRRNSGYGEKPLFNTAALFEEGKLIGFQDKSLLPTYDVFSERRYFEPAAETDIWPLCGQRVGVTICEDIWQHGEAVEYANYPRDPVLELKGKNPDLLINIAASPFYDGREKTRAHVVSRAALTLGVPVLMCNQVGGNGGLIFDGSSLFVDHRGTIIQRGASFCEELIFIDTEKREEPLPYTSCREADLFGALTLGIRDYFQKMGFQKAIFGLSGGIDSAVVACLAKEALGAENLLALILPSRFTPESSVADAVELATRLKIPYKVISIENPFNAYLHLLSPEWGNHKEFGITEENLQARIRGMILMAFSNQWGHLVLSTSNKSEVALGYATLYGDMCGGLSVLGDVIKGDVYKLARWVNRENPLISERIIDKAPSAELRHGQRDSDTLPSYEVVDAVVISYVERHLSPEEIANKHQIPLSLVKDLVHKIHLNEYKRRQAAPSLRVTRRSFAVGRHFPLVQQLEY